MTAKTPIERVQESEKNLERLMLAVPGFRGYKLREQRREADRIVRDQIYRILERSRDDLMKCFQILSDSKTFELTESTNRLIAELDRVAEKINRAAYGYSGFFDAVKVEERELDNMLAFDTRLVGLARKLAEDVSAFRSSLSQGKLDGSLLAEQGLDTIVNALEATFDERHFVIQDVKV